MASGQFEPDEDRVAASPSAPAAPAARVRTYGEAATVAADDAAKDEESAAATGRPDLTLICLHARQTLADAAELVAASRIFEQEAEIQAPAWFATVHARLHHRLLRLRPLLPSRNWPDGPARFLGLTVGAGTLDTAVSFAESVELACAFARSRTPLDFLLPDELDGVATGPVPDPAIAEWHRLAMVDFRRTVAPLRSCWPTAAIVRRDARAADLDLQREYAQSVQQGIAAARELAEKTDAQPNDEPALPPAALWKRIGVPPDQGPRSWETTGSTEGERQVA